ncbi:unnamed protein product [Soboliphyme baturini]|uniref:Secreted protein n=1 Tax=Soboliphyme baturini TaxID=241478 RepID=A0A183IMT1_9BILA|nr:unnamed protein product [Soboliphyme baturini]
MRHTPLETNVILRNICLPFIWFFLKTPKDGAQTPLYCVLSKSLNGVSGRYFSELQQCEPSPIACDSDQCESLYNYSVEACKLVF